MKHYSAIKCIQDRIIKLQQEITKAEAVMDEPEMLSDYYYARNDVDNFNKEINELTETLKELVKTPIVCKS